ncbi:MAG: non-homologous end-joining DNA ligase [Ilumatobacter sp.]|nr:non-homologous end-joining DNA ligase [Ilumatobacter sp.]
MSEGVELEIAGRTVTVTNPAKVMFQTRGDTKLDLVRYYLAVGDAVMRQMDDRPVLLQRFPNGAHGSNFFQKRIPDGAPDWLHTVTVQTPNGTPSRALVIADLAHLVWAVNLGCLGFHSWPVRASDLEHCDELRIDLDPGPGTNYTMAKEAAHETHRLLGDIGVTGYIKSSGNRGLHVYVRLAPTHDSVAVRSAAVAVARELARRRPDLITDSWWKEERGARIFVDFNQNAPHKTVFAPWSVRALDHAPVSFPFPWTLLDTLQPHDMTIATVPTWVADHGDAWAAMNDAPQPMEPFLEMVRRDQAAGLPDAPWPPVYPKMAGEPPRVAPSRAKKPKPKPTPTVEGEGA